jgi:hypothetical protein
MEESNIELSRHVIETLLKENIRAQLKKCEFLKKEEEFLGFRVTKLGLLP